MCIWGNLGREGDLRLHTDRELDHLVEVSDLIVVRLP